MRTAEAAAGGRSVLAERAGIPVLTWPALEAHGVSVVVTTRSGGVSAGPYASLNLGLHVGDDPEAVVENRRRAAAALGLDLGRLVFGEQVHGAAVAVVGAGEGGRGATAQEDALPACDALVTAEAGVGLAVLMADCAPVVLVDPGGPQVAVVHAGWRGTAADVVGAAVGALVARGADPAALLAAVGPAVPPWRYEVGPEVVAAVRARLGPEADGVLAATADGRYRLDLEGANRRLLLAAGVAADRLLEPAGPTGAGLPFFSDRAARPCGRFGLLARVHA